MRRFLVIPRSRAREIKEFLEKEGISYAMEEKSAENIEVYIDHQDMGKGLALIYRLVKETGIEDIQIEGGPVQYRKILVPVDFSPYAENACYMAIMLGSRLNADIELLHAFYIPDYIPMSFDESFSMQGSLSEYILDIRKKAEKQMEDLVNILQEFMERRKISNVKISHSLMRGLPSDAVKYLEEICHPDAIVLGTRTLERRREEDSSMLRIIHHAGVPVLAVPENSDMQFVSEHFRIAYATDFDESDFGTIRKLIGLLGSFSTEVYCVHIGKQPVQEEEKVKMEGMQSYFNRAYPDKDIRCLMIENTDVLAGLDSVIKKNNIQVVAVTTHKRNLLTKIVYPSITKKLYFHTTLPLLVFHS